MSLTKVTYSMIDGAANNVLDFGADASGATDSTAAFTAAGSTAASIEVHIPAGTYKLDTNPSPTGNVTWVFYKGATLTGAGVLTGNIISKSNYAPAWVGSSYADAWGYMPTNSVFTSIPETGNLGFTAIGQVTGNAPSGSATIGFSSAIENKNTGLGSSWCFYGTTLADASNAGATTQCIELDISSTTANLGTTVALAINAGGEAANQIGQPYTFQSCGAAIQIGQNNIGAYANVDFVRGIYITSAALQAPNKTAIELEQDTNIRWALSDGTYLSAISCSATLAADATKIDFNPLGFGITNQANEFIFFAGKSTSAANFIQVQAEASGTAPSVAAKGTDADVDLRLIAQGTGRVDFASGTVDVSAGASVGYLPIKIAGTTYKLQVFAES